MSDQAPDRAGLGAGLLAYSLWGLLPIVFLTAERAGAGALEVVAWRTIWSAPCAAALVWAVGRGAGLRTLSGRALASLALSAALIAGNWLVYVYAVESHQTVTASLGYYVNPLMNMAAGAVLFRERIARSGYVAIALAALGVGLQGLAIGSLPWIPIMLALTFWGYGLVRKQAAADAQTGLLVECLILLVPAVAAAAWTAFNGQGRFGHGLGVTALLVFCGPATVIPLAAFAFAARRLPLTVLGFLQFIAPTLQFTVGVASGEPLTPLRLLSFAFIWSGVAVFAGGAWARSRATARRLQPARA